MADNPYHAYYTTRVWKNIRQAHLDANPFCAFCLDLEGVHTGATVCDHIVPHRGDWTAFVSGPFQSLCDRHHSGLKQRLEHDPDAWDSACDNDGYPIDPKHPANKNDR